MGTLLDLLRVARAQTAAVEAAGFPLAAWVGGAPIWALPLFAILGLLSHFGGFGENSLTDLAYDRRDPSKADHPLVTGRLGLGPSAAFVYGCQGAGIVLFAAIATIRGPSALAVGAFVGYILLGHAYNLLGKRNKPAAVLEISGAFALAFLASAAVWTGRPSELVWVVTLYAGLFTAFQIAVAGELKEIGQAGERNLLRRLGSGTSPGLLGAVSPAIEALVQDPAARADPVPAPWLTTGIGTWSLAWALTGAKIGALGLAAWIVAGPFWAGLSVSIAILVLAGYQVRLLRPGPFDRTDRLRTMGLGEAASYLLLVLAVAPPLGIVAVGAFVALPVVYFGGMNRLLWSRTGSIFAPGV